MDITPLINVDSQIIQGYGEGRFRISGAIYPHPVIVVPERTEAWAVTDMDSLTIEHFQGLIAKAGELDVVLFGSGLKSRRLNPALTRLLKEKGLNVESMDTGAACRTYNVLMAEGRRVGAALIPV